MAQSAGAVEYTDSTSAEELDSHWTSVVDVALNNLIWGYSNYGVLGNADDPSLPSLLCSHWPGVVAPDRILSMGQIELNCVLMLNWIVWNRTALTFKLRTYARLYCLKQNYFDI